MSASATFRQPVGGVGVLADPRREQRLHVARAGLERAIEPFREAASSGVGEVRQLPFAEVVVGGGDRAEGEEARAGKGRGVHSAARFRQDERGFGPVRALGQGERIGEVAQTQQAGLSEAPVAARLVDALKLVRHAIRDGAAARLFEDRGVRERFAEHAAAASRLQRRGPRHRRASCRRTMRSTGARWRGE